MTRIINLTLFLFCSISLYSNGELTLINANCPPAWTEPLSDCSFFPEGQYKWATNPTALPLMTGPCSPCCALYISALKTGHTLACHVTINTCLKNIIDLASSYFPSLNDTDGFSMSLFTRSNTHDLQGYIFPEGSHRDMFDAIFKTVEKNCTLKKAVLYHLVAQGAYDLKKRQILKSDDHELIEKVASSLHVCIADIFIQKITIALEKNPTIKALTFVGGVACNAYITHRLRAYAEKRGLLFYSPSKKYCTDNGAMIAFVGHYKAHNNETSPLTLDIF